jgi:4-amino-4-deoxy-L-arabinose transferase-like glycosyltransferase
MAYGVWRGGAIRIVALLAIGHFVAVQASPMVLARYLLPAMPALCVLIASLLVHATGRAVAVPRARSIVVAIVAVVVLAEPVASSVRLVRLLGLADTRTLAGDWIAAHLPADAHIVSWGAPAGAADYGRPPMHGRRVDQRLAPAQWTAGRTYVVWHRHPLPYSSDPLPSDAPPLRSLATFDPFADGAGAPPPVFEAIDAFYLPLGRLGGVVRPGPRIEILAVEPRG